MDAVKEAEKYIDNLKVDKYAEYEECRKLVEKYEPLVKNLENTFGEKIYAQEVRSLITDGKQHDMLANMYLQQQVYDKALEHYNIAKDKVNSLKDQLANNSAAAAYIQEFEAKSVSFVTKFAEDQLVNEAAPTINEANDLLRSANQVLSREMAEKGSICSAFS
jgi:hypothetical protein